MMELWITLPNDFGELFEKYKARFEPITSESVKRDETPPVTILESTHTGKPSTLVEIDLGYLILDGEKITIGGLKTKKFRLIETLCQPFGTAKTIDAVCDYIKGDASNDPYLARSKKTTFLEQTFKEVQRAISEYRKSSKIKRLSKISLKIDSQKVWLETNS